MSPELIGILAVGATLLAVQLSSTFYMVSWLRNLDRRVAVIEGVLIGKGLLDPSGSASVSGD